jgi:uncharacterized protein
VLLILPPSETKRDGGAEGSRLDLDALGFGSLRESREAAIHALGAVSVDLDAGMRALKLGRTQQFEVERNRVLETAPVMPAVDRYTGVIYDALDAASLDDAARDFARGHLAIGSALFGLLRADDPIPAYRLSHDSRLPGLALGKLWRAGVSAELQRVEGLILDLRSEAYAALGRAPAGSFYLRVLSEGADGRRTALSHFNKHAKGEFTRRVLEAGVDHEDAESLLRWARRSRITLDYGVDGELDLVV